MEKHAHTQTATRSRTSSPMPRRQWPLSRRQGHSVGSAHAHCAVERKGGCPTTVPVTVAWSSRSCASPLVSCVWQCVHCATCHHAASCGSCWRRSFQTQHLAQSWSRELFQQIRPLCSIAPGFCALQRTVPARRQFSLLQHPPDFDGMTWANKENIDTAASGRRSCFFGCCSMDTTRSRGGGPFPLLRRFGRVPASPAGSCPAPGRLWIYPSFEQHGRFRSRFFQEWPSHPRPGAPWASLHVGFRRAAGLGQVSLLVQGRDSGGSCPCWIPESPKWTPVR